MFRKFYHNRRTVTNNPTGGYVYALCIFSGLRNRVFRAQTERIYAVRRGRRMVRHTDYRRNDPPISTDSQEQRLRRQVGRYNRSYIFLVIFGVIGASLLSYFFNLDAYIVTDRGSTWNNIVETLKGMVSVRSGGLCDIRRRIIAGFFTAPCRRQGQEDTLSRPA